MARRTVITVSDDLDGTPAAQTVSFSLDDRDYEIDLSPGNAARLRELMRPFTASARRTSTRPTSTGPTSTAAATDHTDHPDRAVARRVQLPTRQPARVDPEQARAVRQWARSHGFDVPARGKIPAAVLTAYHCPPVEGADLRQA